MVSIPRLQIPQTGPFTPTLDFSPLQEIGKSIERQQQRQTLADLGRELASGNLTYDQAAGRALASGDRQSAMTLAQLGQNQVNNDWRRSEAERSQRNSDRSYNLQAQRLGMEGRAQNGIFGTPIYGRDPQTGETVVGAIAKDGSFRRLDTGGVQINPGVSWQDFGTYRQGFDSKTGKPVTPQVSVDTAGKKAAEAVGKEVGEARASYARMTSKMPGLETVVNRLGELAKDATYTYAGQAVDFARTQAGAAPRKSAIARTEYDARVSNQILPLLRETFGAQFTQREGETLRATMGDANKTPAEKQAVLTAFIEQKRRDVEALATQAFGNQAPPQGATQRSPQPQQFQDGQRARNANGRIIEYRGGRWVPVQ